MVTHDIPNNDVFLDLIMDEEDEWIAYAYILGRDGGVPLVYTDLDTSGIKNKNGKPRWKDAWNDPRMAKMIAFHNVTHGESMTVLEGNDDMLVLKRGEKGIVVLNKSTRAQSLSLKTECGWFDLMSDQSVKAGIELKVPAKSFMLLVQK